MNSICGGSVAVPRFSRSATIRCDAAVGAEQRDRVRYEPRNVRVPPQNDEHAVVGEVVVVRAERLRRVEIVLRQRQAARGHRRPRVDEAEEDRVELSIRAADEVAAFALDHLDVGPIVQAAGSRAVVTHELNHQRVHLDGRDLAAAGRERREDVGAAAGADDERLAAGVELKRQRAVRIAQLVDAVELSVPRHDARPRVGVDVEAREKLRRIDAFDRVDARVRVPAALRDARARVLVHLPAHRLDGAGDDVKQSGPAVRQRRDGQHGGARNRHDAEIAATAAPRPPSARPPPGAATLRRRAAAAGRRSPTAPSDAPRRSAKYSEPEPARFRSKIIDSAMPPRKNGTSGVMKYSGRRLQLERILDEDPQTRRNREAVEQREEAPLSRATAATSASADARRGRPVPSRAAPSRSRRTRSGTRSSPNRCASGRFRRRSPDSVMRNTAARMSMGATSYNMSHQLR